MDHWKANLNGRVALWLLYLWALRFGDDAHWCASNDYAWAGITNEECFKLIKRLHPTWCHEYEARTGRPLTGATVKKRLEKNWRIGGEDKKGRYITSEHPLRCDLLREDKLAQTIARKMIERI